MNSHTCPTSISISLHTGSQYHAKGQLDDLLLLCFLAFLLNFVEPSSSKQGIAQSRGMSL